MTIAFYHNSRSGRDARRGIDGHSSEIPSSEEAWDPAFADAFLEFCATSLWLSFDRTFLRTYARCRMCVGQLQGQTTHEDSAYGLGQSSRAMKKGKKSERRSDSEPKNPAILTPDRVFQHPARLR